MKTIYKYELDITDVQEIETYIDYKPLSVQFQRGKLCLWMAVDTDTSPIDAMVVIYGTGNPADEMNNYKYVGTVQVPEGTPSFQPLVWHVFIEK